MPVRLRMTGQPLVRQRAGRTLPTGQQAESLSMSELDCTDGLELLRVLLVQDVRATLTKPERPV
jgi:hypothetical protein